MTSHNEYISFSIRKTTYNCSGLQVLMIRSWFRFAPIRQRCRFRETDYLLSLSAFRSFADSFKCFGFWFAEFDIVVDFCFRDAIIICVASAFGLIKSTPLSICFRALSLVAFGISAVSLEDRRQAHQQCYNPWRIKEQKTEDGRHQPQPFRLLGFI